MRLLTRSDFDGLACAAFLEELGVIDHYKFVHPKDVQDGLIEVTDDDVLANIPYVPGCGLWFDHHSSEQERLQILEDFKFEGLSKHSPSCAHVIFDYYQADERLHKFLVSGLLCAVDRSDAAAYTVEEIKNPTGWILLSFIMDPRTGLGRYSDYRISNYELMKNMIGYCRRMSLEEILQNVDVKQRVKRYFDQELPYELMLVKNSHASGNVIIIDLREQGEIVTGNRFLEYALYPRQNVSIRVIWGKNKQNVVFTVGHSIINRTCKTDVGKLMLKYGGGGHAKVGTCQVPIESAARVFQELIAELKQAG